MKKFKEFSEDVTMTAADAGIPQDTKDMGPKKRKRHPITRRFIEINGKRKRIEK